MFRTWKGKLQRRDNKEGITWLLRLIFCLQYRPTD